MNHKCSLCNGKLEDSKKLVIKRGRSSMMNVKQCTKCGHSFSDLYEGERVRRELNPSILDKIKRLFSDYDKVETLSFFRGKVL